MSNHHYSLFIDESGGFDRRSANGQDKRWIVAGVLCGCDASKAVMHFEAALLPLTKQYGEAYCLTSKEDFHLSVLRSKLTERYKEQYKASTYCPANYEQIASHRASQDAGRIARSVLDAIAEQCFPVRFAATVNEHRVGVEGGRRGDWNYRLMMLDILALVETILPENEAPAHLDLVIATRIVKIDGKSVFMSRHGDIKLAIEELQPSFEAGLATRGLIELQHHHGLHLELVGATDPAHPMAWGLIAADFVANTVFNRHTTIIGRLYNDLCTTGRLHIFETLGAYNERRARVAARDGDYVAALRWWSTVEGKTQDKSSIEEYFVRLFREAFSQDGPNSSRATIDSLVERFWQDTVRHGDYARLYAQLRRVEAALETLKKQDAVGPLLASVFRLRNFMLTIANHAGNVGEATRLIGAQKEATPELSLNSDNLALILDFDLYSVEAAINALRFEAALALAENYCDLVQRYHECWNVMNRSLFAAPQAQPDSGFYSSRVYIRAECTLLRCWLLTFPNPAGFGEECDDAPDVVAAQALRRYDELQRLTLHRDDRSRVHNYGILACLKLEMYDHALAMGHESLKVSRKNPFDVFWALRAANDALLSDYSKFEAVARSMLDGLRALEPHLLDGKKDHPYDLIWREYGLLVFLLEGDAEQAEACYRTSLSIAAISAPIHSWLKAVVMLHLRLLSDEATDWPQFFAGEFQNQPKECLNLAGKAYSLQKEHAGKDGKSLLQAARTVRIYLKISEWPADDKVTTTFLE